MSTIVLEAWEELEGARRAWPHNEAVESYRDTVRKEAARFRVDLGEEEDPPEDPTEGEDAHTDEEDT